MNNPLISIIIPVYNAEKYLRQCLDSVIAQSYTNWEGLLIDDGSTDGSGRICDEYSVADTRFRVIHKENGGVCSARNRGLDVSCGEYVLFADADDYLFPFSLHSLANGLSDTVRSSVGGFIHVDDNGEELFKLKNDYDNIISLQEAILDFYNKDHEKDWQRYLWNRLLNLKVINDNRLRFREDIYFKEDGLFLVQYLCRDKSNVYYCKDIVYNYRRNQASATASLENSYNPKIKTNIKAHLAIVSEIKETFSEKKIQNIAIENMLGSFIWIIGMIDTRQEIVSFAKEYINDVRKISGIAFYKYIGHFMLSVIYHKIKAKFC